MNAELVLRIFGLGLEGLGLWMTWRDLAALQKYGEHLEGSHVLHVRPGVIRLNPPPYVTWKALEKSENITEQGVDKRDRESRARDAKVLRELTHRAGLGLILVGIGAVLTTFSDEIARLVSVILTYWPS